MIRTDIIKAIEATPPQVRDEVEGSATASLELLIAHLPDDEVVEAITSASPRPETDANSLLVITDTRLIFIAPAPQVVAWQLKNLTRAQVSMGYFFIEGDAGDYSPGLRDDSWGEAFEANVKRAAAIAALRGN